MLHLVGVRKVLFFKNAVLSCNIYSGHRTPMDLTHKSYKHIKPFHAQDVCVLFSYLLFLSCNISSAHCVWRRASLCRLSHTAKTADQSDGIPAAKPKRRQRERERVHCLNLASPDTATPCTHGRPIGWNAGRQAEKTTERKRERVFHLAFGQGFVCAIFRCVG